MASSVILEIKPLGFPWETKDPFLFCVHHADNYPKGNAEMGPDISLAGHNLGNDFTKVDGFRMYHGQRVPGFPAHPHRGFETITIARKGLVDHSDSLGAAGRFGAGDVQWMTAGKGVQHAEMFPLLNRDKPNPLEIFQIWLNLPSQSKMVEPYFGMLWKEDIPIYQHQDEQQLTTTVNVIAGELGGKIPPSPPPDSWAANKDHEVAVWTVTMEPRATWELPTASANAHRTLYFYEGDSLRVNNEDIPFYHLAKVKANEPVTLKNGKAKSNMLILQGKPINEPVVQHGPFVMNKVKEIEDAFMEYRETQFGGWPWSSHDHVHPREKGRFALHADGRLETKG